MIFTVTIILLQVREVINDFAVTIAILSMVFLDYMVGLRTPKLQVPREFKA